MTDYAKYPGLEGLISFHGHMCPGLAIGYRATMAALERLGVERSGDEELVAIVENDSCSTDAVQYLAGATFGKGNLFFRDWGKQVFTFARRDGGQAVRVSLRRGALDQAPAAGDAGDETDERRLKTEFILAAPAELLFDVRAVDIALPPRAQIHRSLDCDGCGEPVMETRVVERDGSRLCPECAA